MKRQHFAYRATTTQGHIVKGSHFAHTRSELYSHLARQNLHLLSCHGRLSNFLPHLGHKHKVGPSDIKDFCLHMKLMDEAGVPVVDALLDAHDAMPKMQPILTDLIEKIRHGASLSDALRHHENIFSSMACHILQISEQPGRLADGFEKVYEHLDWKEKNSQALKKALRYPLLVLVLLIFAVWMMATYVLPQVAQLSHTLGQPSDTSYGWSVIFWAGAFCLAAAMCTLILRRFSNSVRFLTDQAFLLIPVLGEFLKRKDLSVFVHAFRVCIEADLDLLDALIFSLSGVSNRYMHKKLKALHADILNGQTLSHAFQVSGLFDSTTIRLIKISEVTGQLRPLLNKIEAHYAQDLKQRLEKLLFYLQPALIGLVGCFMAWIILGIFYPIYDQLIQFEDMV